MGDGRDSGKVVPLFGEDASRMMRRWASHPLVRQAKTPEAKHAAACQLEWARTDALWSEDIKRREQEEAAPRKTLQGRAFLALIHIFAASVFYGTEAFHSSFGRLFRWHRKRKMVAKCQDHAGSRAATKRHNDPFTNRRSTKGAR